MQTGSKVFSKALRKALENMVLTKVTQRDRLDAEWLDLMCRSIKNQPTVIVHHYTDTRDYIQIEYELRTSSCIKFGRCVINNQ